MNKVFIVLAVLFINAVPVWSQKTGNFEGKITYKIEYDGENSTMLGAFGPSSYDYMVNDQKLKMKINGGMAAMMMGEFLIDGKKKESYMIKDSEKTAYKIEPEEGSDAETDMNVEEMNEKEEILGYDCQKYKVTVDTDEGQVVQYIWAASDLNLDMGYKPDEQTGAASDLFIEGVEGLPLKIHTVIPGMDMDLTMTASNIEWKDMDKSLFVVPAGYEIKKFDAKALGKGMGF